MKKQINWDNKGAGVRGRHGLWVRRVVRWLVPVVMLIAGALSALPGAAMGTAGGGAATIYSVAGALCSAETGPSSPDYAACQSAITTLKEYGVEAEPKCLDAAGNDLGCRPISTDDMHLVLTTLQEMATAMGYGASNLQGFRNMLKLGPNEYIGLQNRNYNGYSGFTQQPWDFFAVDFDLLRNMLQGPGQAEAWIKSVIAHEMYHVIDGRYDFAYSKSMHSRGYNDTTPQQEDMSSPKPGTGAPVSEHGADGPYDDWAEAGAAEMYADDLAAVYIINYVGFDEASKRSEYIEGVWDNMGLPVEQVTPPPMLNKMAVVDGPSNQVVPPDTGNLPVYPGAQNVNVTNRGLNRLNRIRFETTDTLATVFGYYESTLGAKGWVEAPRPEGHPRLRFTYAGRGEAEPWNADLFIVGEALAGGKSAVNLYFRRWPDANRAITLPNGTQVQVTRGTVAERQIATLTVTVVTPRTAGEIETFLKGKLPEYGWVPDDNSSINSAQGLTAYFARIVDEKVGGGKVTVTARDLPGGQTEVTLLIAVGTSDVSTIGGTASGGGETGATGTPGTSGTTGPGAVGMPRSGAGRDGSDLAAYLLGGLLAVVLGAAMSVKGARKARRG